MHWTCDMADLDLTNRLSGVRDVCNRWIAIAVNPDDHSTTNMLARVALPVIDEILNALGDEDTCCISGVCDEHMRRNEARDVHDPLSPYYVEHDVDGAR